MDIKSFLYILVHFLHCQTSEPDWCTFRVREGQLAQPDQILDASLMIYPFPAEHFDMNFIEIGPV